MPRDLIDWDRVEFLIQEQYAQAHVKEPEEFTKMTAPTPDRSWVTTEDIESDRRLSPVARLMSEGGYQPTSPVEVEFPELAYNERWKVVPTSYPEVKILLQQKWLFGIWISTEVTFSDPDPQKMQQAAKKIMIRRKESQSNLEKKQAVSGVYPPKRLSDV